MEHKDKQQLAEDRTDWAWQRNLLAEQRNFSAWVRTGLTALAVGFAVIKLFGETEPLWMIYIVGGCLMGAGILTHLLAFATYLRTFRRIRQQQLPGLPIWSVSLVMAALLTSGLLMVLLLLADAGVLALDGFGLKP